MTGSSDEDDVEMIQSNPKDNISTPKTDFFVCWKYIKKKTDTTQWNRRVFLKSVKIEPKPINWQSQSSMGDPCFGVDNPSLFSFSDEETDENDDEIEQIMYDGDEDDDDDDDDHVYFHDDTQTVDYWKERCLSIQKRIDCWQERCESIQKEVDYWQEKCLTIQKHHIQHSEQDNKQILKLMDENFALREFKEGMDRIMFQLKEMTQNE